MGSGQLAEDRAERVVGDVGTGVVALGRVEAAGLGAQPFAGAWGRPRVAAPPTKAQFVLGQAPRCFRGNATKEWHGQCCARRGRRNDAVREANNLAATRESLDSI